MAVGLPATPAVEPSVPEPEAPTPAPPEDDLLTINGLGWDQYVAINDALGDHAHIRVLYLDGSLTFVSPALAHEWRSDALDKILLALALGCDIELCPIGSTTLRRIKKEAGAEGDKAYYLGDNALRIGRRDALDLATDPPPDLAIEVENTHKSTDAVEIYARLGIREVWRHDVRRRALTFWSLCPDGTYAEVARSLNLPFLTPADVQAQFQRAEESPSFNRWFAQLTDWVRTEIRPRLDAGPGPEERHP